MKTIGQLYDCLKAIKKAEKEVEGWETAVARAFAPDTIKRRQEGLQGAVDWLNHLRMEKIEDEE